MNTRHDTSSCTRKRVPDRPPRVISPLVPYMLASHRRTLPHGPSSFLPPPLLHTHNRGRPKATYFSTQRPTTETCGVVKPYLSLLRSSPWPYASAPPQSRGPTCPIPPTSASQGTRPGSCPSSRTTTPTRTRSSQCLHPSYLPARACTLSRYVGSWVPPSPSLWLKIEYMLLPFLPISFPYRAVSCSSDKLS